MVSISMDARAHEDVEIRLSARRFAIFAMTGLSVDASAHKSS